MILGARRSRLVAGIWALVGLGFLAAGVILWVDAQRISFELPAAVFAFVLALAWRRQRAILDRHGIRTVHAFREHRLLWAGIDHVVVDRASWVRPALVLHPKGDRAPVPVPASAGLHRRQRNRLLELLTDLSRQHGFGLLIHADGQEKRVTGRPSTSPGRPRGLSAVDRPDAVTHDRPAVDPTVGVPAATAPAGGPRTGSGSAGNDVERPSDDSALF